MMMQSMAQRPCHAVLCCDLQSLSTFLAEINHHEGLYNKLLQVQAAYACTVAAAGGGVSSGANSGPLLSPQQLSDFCPETLVVAHKYQQDFEKFGIHLKDSQQRAKVAQLLALNQHFPAQFNATLVSRG
jgi:Zn-dependent oligopeptidase